MQDKLQELTEKLYNEGLSKGKQEGEEILAKARKQAEETIAKANEEAEAIKARAQREAEELKTKVTGDVRMAALQSLTATRQSIENVIVTQMTDKDIASALESADYVRKIIETVAKSFNPAGQDPEDIALVLPESMKKDLEPFVTKELAKILKAGVTATFSKKISGGFTIGPKDGGYFISFSEETFKALISEYLRPATRKLLFG
ncbi:MAG: hypothetical protein IAB80_10040 [Bacteroidetes bacterium]|uniref:V-type ATP synthase subunit E n=1 Tax=Candidatus Cryptobacteroides excrementipullorum TaxID=2840761 RepID=A0A9D9NMH3_9BACT|nr:hypothetical protein [Candidatus Cryptobacteroides excrementipullorum]